MTCTAETLSIKTHLAGAAARAEGGGLYQRSQPAPVWFLQRDGAVRLHAAGGWGETMQLVMRNSVPIKSANSRRGAL